MRNMTKEEVTAHLHAEHIKNDAEIACLTAQVNDLYNSDSLDTLDAILELEYEIERVEAENWKLAQNLRKMNDGADQKEIDLWGYRI